jgi:hypothetical protein
MSWVAPGQYYGWNTQAAQSSWAGGWPPAVPREPPPVPTGVDSRSWLGGQWQPNPMYRPNQRVPNPGVMPNPSAMPAWAPHPSWGVPMANAFPNFNPYKRIPNPGSAEYWATKISDNSLQMENMIPYVSATMICPNHVCIECAPLQERAT